MRTDKAALGTGTSGKTDWGVVFHNIQQPYYGYLLSALLLVCATLLLLAPGALTLTAREQRALQADTQPAKRRK